MFVGRINIKYFYEILFIGNFVKSTEQKVTIKIS